MDRAVDDQLVHAVALLQIGNLLCHGLFITDQRSGQGRHYLMALVGLPEVVHVLHRRAQLAAFAADHVEERLLVRGGQVVGFFAGFGDEGVDAEHGQRLLQLLGRLEGLAVALHGRHHVVRRELPGKGEGQAQGGGQLGAEGAGTQQPDRHVQPGTGYCHQSLAGFGLGEVMAQLIEHLREVLTVGTAPAQGPGGEHVGARGAAQTQVDTAGVEGLQGAELLGNLQR